jgi:phospholipase C
MAESRTAAGALGHVVVVLFENRSFDNVLGHLYGPGDGKTFEGVIGKGLSNPIPAWAEHGAERKVVPYTVATDMDAPNPDSGEEWYHTNTQLFGVLHEHNRFKIGDEVTEPWNAPPAGATPTMDGFVADYISTFTAEMGRQPTYDEYAQIMTGYTPEQLPVLNGIAREFGVFDHWFSEVPSQTFMNRSFWTAATSSGIVVNSPVKKWFALNDAETIFERLEHHGRSWKIYVMEPMRLSFHGVIHYPRLQHRLATNIVPFADFERDAAAGTLPDFSLIEPNFIAGHGDYHPAFGRALARNVDVGTLDPPSSMLAGEAFLERIFSAYRSSTSESGSNVWNTALLIGWDEPGGTYDHVPPGPVPPPDPEAPAGELGFRFDRSGYRVPAILVSPWIPQGAVFNDEYRHTSLIATLRRVWDLGAPFTQRDAGARTFDDLFTLEEPRDPETWAPIAALPVPAWHLDEEALGGALSGLGTSMGRGVIEHARQLGLELPPELDDPDAEITPRTIVDVLRQVTGYYFPRLAPGDSAAGPTATSRAPA